MRVTSFVLAVVLKRVPVSQLRPGMFLHGLSGSWLDHPFWRNSFLLEAQHIDQLLATGVTEAWINAGKGLDAQGGVSEADVRAEAEQVLAAATAPLPLHKLPDPEAAGRELRALRRRSMQAVRTMFREVRMGQAIDASKCLPVVQDISDSLRREPGRFIAVARLKTRDEYTYMHSVAVCALMISLGRQLGFNDAQARRAGVAGLLHDVGKAMVPLHILNKPAKLTDDEFRIMRSHPVRGHAVLSGSTDPDAMALDVCLHHHEKLDGTGYPHRLSGERISLFSRMGAVCDVYDAVTSDRPYKSGWAPAEALRQMASWKDHFDPVVFQAFVKTVGIYPIGSLVRLTSGRLAVVLTHNADNLLAPRVKVFYSVTGRHRIEPMELDLGSGLEPDRIAGLEPADEWDLGDLSALWLPPGMPARTTAQA